MDTTEPALPEWLSNLNTLMINAIKQQFECTEAVAKFNLITMGYRIGRRTTFNPQGKLLVARYTLNDLHITDEADHDAVDAVYQKLENKTIGNIDGYLTRFTELFVESIDPSQY